MRLKLSTVLYPAVVVLAIGALVLYLQRPQDAATPSADTAALAALRAGDMQKLVLHDAPRPTPDDAFEKPNGGTGSLADFRGKIALVNFWATWCAPCREEMPTLSQLQAGLGGTDFEVVTIATGRNPLPAIKTFFDEIGVDNLPQYRDPDQKIARGMGVLGLPTTVILNRDGQEIARLQGDADWNSDSARAILRTLADTGTTG